MHSAASLPRSRYCRDCTALLSGGGSMAATESAFEPMAFTFLLRCIAATVSQSSRGSTAWHRAEKVSTCWPVAPMTAGRHSTQGFGGTSKCGCGGSGGRASERCGRTSDQHIPHTHMPAASACEICSCSSCWCSVASLAWVHNRKDHDGSGRGYCDPYRLLLTCRSISSLCPSCAFCSCFRRSAIT